MDTGRKTTTPVTMSTPQLLHCDPLTSIYKLYSCSSPCLPPSPTQTLLKPLTMSQTAKSASSQGTDAKDKGAPAPAASSKATKTGEPGMGSYRVSHRGIKTICRNGVIQTICFYLKGQFNP